MEQIQPWYKQFWPWFLITLPGIVVIASMITIYIAVTNPDRLVKKDQHEDFGPVLTEKSQPE